MAWPVVLDTISLYRGDSRSLPFYFWSDDAKTIPIDLTGFGTVFTGQIRKRADDPMLESLVIDSSQATTGLLKVTISPSSWEALASYSSVGWDLQVATSDGTEVTTLVRSAFAITKDYTHA